MPSSRRSAITPITSRQSLLNEVRMRLPMAARGSRQIIPGRNKLEAPYRRNGTLARLPALRMDRVVGTTTFQGNAGGYRNRGNTRDGLNPVQDVLLHAQSAFRFPNLRLRNKDAHG